MPDTVQIAYSLARREAAPEFFPRARAANVGVIAREPLANGFLADGTRPASRWETGDIRARMPAPYVAQLAALGQRVAELATRRAAPPPSWRSSSCWTIPRSRPRSRV